MNHLVESLNACGGYFATRALPLLWQSSLLIGLLFAFDWALRKRVRATIRYAIWMLALVKLALPPSLTLPTSAAFWVPVQNVQRTVAQPLAVMRAAVEHMAKTQPITMAPVVLTWTGILFIVWLVVALLLAGWIFAQWRKVVQMLDKAVPAPPEVQALLESCRQQLGLKRPVPIRCVASANTPAICGLWRPVIIIPATLPLHLSESEMRSALLHELAHLKRGDLWVNHAQAALQLFYWYNPLLWLANARIRRVREQAVDEMVLVELRESAAAYPTTLLQVAKLAAGRVSFGVGLIGILEPGSGLKERIRHMMERPLPRTARVGMSGLLLITLLAFVALPMGCHRAAPTAEAPPQLAESKPMEAKTQMEVQTQGRNLSASDAAELESKIATNAEDLSAREEVLVYYFTQQFKTPAVREMRQQHILWLIEHHPDVAIESSYLSLNPMLDGDTYQKGKELWLSQVQANPQNLLILKNAAAFCLLFDRPKAEELLKKAQGMEPQNPAWSEQLGQLYKLNGESAKALQEFEKANSANSPNSEDFSKMDDLAVTAFATGDMIKAQKYASELLEQAAHDTKNWNYGNAIMHGNVVLGRIALREGKMDEAKKYLLDAGNTPGSPQLNSFGPNMTLAADLLAKGETQSVLEYFQECAKFWKMGAEKLDTWAALVREGKAPDFGGNLLY